jgi:putative CocE/NonD family hydrolase
MTNQETPFRRWVGLSEKEADKGRLEMGIPMRDGVELAADIYLPRGHEGQSLPAIVEVTPYNKDNVTLMSGDATLYQNNGYVFVGVDCRGRGKSEGEWAGFSDDVPDTHDVIEWVARQPWCNGKVGTTGLSYMGWVQWAAASTRPPHLCAMVSTSAAGRWQQEIPYTNGIFQLYFAWWAYMTRRRIDEGYGLGQIDWDEALRILPFKDIGRIIDTPTTTWDNLADRDTLDDFWKNLRFDDRYDQIDIPCLHVTGWYDQEDLLGAIHHYQLMMADSPARDRQYLIVGPWSHVKSRNPDRFYSDIDHGAAAAWDMDAEHVAFFDYWLKGIDNGVGELARVRIFEPGRNAWREPEHWPTATTSTEMYLSEEALVDTPSTAQGSRAFDYDPLNPLPTGIDVRLYPFEDVPLDQTANETRADIVAFTSEPVSEDVVLSGWPHLVFFGATDGDDTDWHVKITDVDPAGVSRRVTQGCLRAACRTSLESPTAVTPDDVLEYNVELWPTHHVFLPGHSIRVTVTSSDFPWYARSMNRFGPVRFQDEPRVARNTVYVGGDYPSRCILPLEIVGDDQ